MSPSGSARRFFEVIVHQENIKAFSTALHLLQKIGKEMTLEMEGSTFTLRALNDSKSTFAAVEFTDSYFDSFQLAATLKTFSCKVNVKPICAIFRSLKGMKVLKIRGGMVDNSEHELIFEIILHNGITRTYSFRYCDCEVMSAVFDEDSCSYVRAKPKLFVQLLTHIHQSPEICIEASSESFSVRSFHKADDGAMAVDGTGARFMQTALSVNIQEFEQYEYVSSAPNEELIFCVKDVNAFLGCSEILDAPDFDLFFSGSGRAIKYAARYDTFTASLILATIESAHHRMRTQQQQASQQLSQQQQRQEQVARSEGFTQDTPARPASSQHMRQQQEVEASNTPSLKSMAEEGGGEFIPAQSADDLSQPIIRYRRNFPRQEPPSSSFIRYANSGEEDDPSQEESVRGGSNMGMNMEIAYEGNKVVATGTSSAVSGNISKQRRKRFLDEASDDD